MRTPVPSCRRRGRLTRHRRTSPALRRSCRRPRDHVAFLETPLAAALLGRRPPVNRPRLSLPAGRPRCCRPTVSPSFARRASRLELPLSCCLSALACERVSQLAERDVDDLVLALVPARSAHRVAGRARPPDGCGRVRGHPLTCSPSGRVMTSPRFDAGPWPRGSVGPSGNPDTHIGLLMRAIVSADVRGSPAWNLDADTTALTVSLSSLSGATTLYLSLSRHDPDAPLKTETGE